MAYIKTYPGQLRFEVDPAPPYFDKCAFSDHGQAAGPENYVEGRLVRGFGLNNSLSCSGHMCLDCMKYFGLQL